MSGENYAEYFDEIASRSLYSTGIDVNTDDKYSPSRPARAIWIFQRAAARQTPVAYWLQGSYETVKAKRLTPRLRR